MNELTGQVYEIWDDELNSIWKRIKEKMPEEDFEKLREKQREWVTDKEKKVDEACAEYEGGSFASVAWNDVGAQLTRERVYELAKYLR